MPSVKLPEGESIVKRNGGVAQILRDLGAKLQRLPCYGMTERQLLGV